MDNKEKLINFNINECKYFKFTKEEYIKLEIEYNRYNLYNTLIKNIEKILNINDQFEYNKRKKYENKNIIERCVLECINHGISPHINKTNNTNNTKDMKQTTNDTKDNKLVVNNINYNTDTDNDTNFKDIDYTMLSKHIFFNTILNHSEHLSKIYYFEKMILEYNEKKIKISTEIITMIIKEFINAETQFIKINDEFHKMINKLIMNKDINKDINKQINKQNDCSITFNNNNFTIKYKDYIKVIDDKRYYKLIKNYEKPFPFNMIHMLLRYSIFDTSSQQWSIGIDLYETISELFDISFETFASPLNFNMYRFCSLFYDTDSIFGSVGSFYNLTCEHLLLNNIKGVFFNPPYLPILMEKCSLQCLNLLDEMNKKHKDFTVFSFLPNWTDADYIKSLIESNYMIEYKIVNKGNYILQEKDRGKLITGTFDLLVIVLNSNKMKWNDDKLSEMKTNFNTIIKNMKEETKELFYKK